MKEKEIQLKNKIKELEIKLKNINVSGYGSIRELHKSIKLASENLQSLTENLCCNNTIFFILFAIDSIIAKELNKSENLCLECDGVEKILMYESALTEIANGYCQGGFCKERARKVLVE